jgi:hypothetical protein
MARVRTRFAKAHRRAASKFLAKALKNHEKASTKCDAAWIKSANLQPILHFLSK